MGDSFWMAALVVVGAVCLVAVALPLFRPAKPWLDDERSELDRLFEEKGRVLRTLKDLDHERAAGLLTEADWRAARDEHVAEAVKLNREIAALTGVDVSMDGVPGRVPAESRS